MITDDVVNCRFIAAATLQRPCRQAASNWRGLQDTLNLRDASSGRKTWLCITKDGITLKVVICGASRLLLNNATTIHLHIKIQDLSICLKYLLYSLLTVTENTRLFSLLKCRKQVNETGNKFGEIFLVHSINCDCANSSRFFKATTT